MIDEYGQNRWQRDHWRLQIAAIATVAVALVLFSAGIMVVAFG